ncbi:hypothetical protein Bca4012_074489 [Brassica carinata]
MTSESVKHMPIHGGTTISAASFELKGFLSAAKPRKASTFVYAFVITFVAFTVLLVFTPSPITVSHSIPSYILPNVTASTTLSAPAPENLTPAIKNATFESPIGNGTNSLASDSRSDHAWENMLSPDNKTGDTSRSSDKQLPAETPLFKDPAVNSSAFKKRKQRRKSWMRREIKSLKNCDFHEGEWVKDDSYPLYKPGSCNLIDEQFTCISNGRPDVDFQKLKWKPKQCTLPREDYYQEGSNVHPKLDVDEAFRKALTTWGQWVDENVNPKKSLVFFRGYSPSHFSGGQWNAGGACDDETEPIKNETYLTPYPSKMLILERVLKGMKSPVTYLNITRLTDYRKDAHPSVYRKHKLSAKERKSPLLYQDCSHWCLPGVPDSWNEILYAEMLVKLHQLRGNRRRKPKAILEIPETIPVKSLFLCLESSKTTVSLESLGITSNTLKKGLLEVFATVSEKMKVNQMYEYRYEIDLEKFLTTDADGTNQFTYKLKR